MTSSGGWSLRPPARQASALMMTLALALVWLVTSPPSPAAASCAYNAEDPRGIENADVIFTGELLGSRTAKLGREREYTFRVDRVYKGAAYAEQLVVSDANSSVALDIKPPGPFLVQARFGGGATVGPAARLTSTSCSGTRVLTDPAALPATLGPGAPPADGSSHSVTSRFSSNLWIGGGVALIVLAVIVSRRGRRNTN